MSNLDDRVRKAIDAKNAAAAHAILEADDPDHISAEDIDSLVEVALGLNRDADAYYSKVVNLLPVSRQLALASNVGKFSWTPDACYILRKEESKTLREAIVRGAIEMGEDLAQIYEAAFGRISANVQAALDMKLGDCGSVEEIASIVNNERYAAQTDVIVAAFQGSRNYSPHHVAVFLELARAHIEPWRIEALEKKAAGEV